MSDPATTPIPVVILISGRGSNLHAIIEAVEQDGLPIEIRAVISNRPAAAGLQVAAEAGIATDVIDHTEFTGRAAFDHALQARIDACQPELVILAGFMRILTEDFVTHYRGRMLNIHPSLLPEFPGLNTHQRALDAGCRVHGASVHFVTADMDGGPVFLQARVAVRADDTAEQLASRVLEQEHQLYPQAIRLFAEGRLSLGDNDDVLLDASVLEQPLQLTARADTPCS